MCGGGSGGGTQTVTQVTQVPQFIQDYFNWQAGTQKDLFNQAGSIYNANAAYQPYPDARIQPLDPDQLTAMETMRNNAGFKTDPNTGALSASGQAPLGFPQLQTAVQRNTEAAAPFTTPGVAQSYMNPYIQNVIDPTFANLNRQQTMEGDKIRDQATQAGAFGGDRQAVADQSNARNWDQIKAQTAGTLLDQGYNTAGQMFNQDQNRLMASSQLAASQAGQAQQMGAFNSGQMMNVGNVEQQQGQNFLNQNYLDFLNQRQWPYQNFGFLESALRAQPFTPLGGTTSSQVPTQGMLQQAAGLGLTGAAIYGLTGPWGG